MIEVPATETATALVLRPWLERDIPALVQAHKDPAMRRWLMRHFEDEEQARAAIEIQEQEWAERTRFVFAVTSPDGPDPIGSVMIRRIHKAPDAAEVGYWTAPEARGASVAGRAAEAALRWTLDQWAADGVHITRLELIHTLGNAASCRVAQKLGFEFAQDLPAFPPKFPNPGHLHVRSI